MKMNTKLKYLPIAAFAAIALTLAGCGGGGGRQPRYIIDDCSLG